MKLVDGPTRITLFRQKKEQLQSYTAGPENFLLVKKTDGSTQHIPGPCSMFLHPVDDVSIEVKQATVIAASQALVINRQATASKEGHRVDYGVEQRIVKGPARFMPAADEWVQATLNEHIADHSSYLEVRAGSVTAL